LTLTLTWLTLAVSSVSLMRYFLGLFLVGRSGQSGRSVILGMKGDWRKVVVEWGSGGLWSISAFRRRTNRKEWEAPFSIGSPHRLVSNLFVFPSMYCSFSLHHTIPFSFFIDIFDPHWIFLPSACTFKFRFPPLLFLWVPPNIAIPIHLLRHSGSISPFSSSSFISRALIDADSFLSPPSLFGHKMTPFLSCRIGSIHHCKNKFKTQKRSSVNPWFRLLMYPSVIWYFDASLSYFRHLFFLFDFWLHFTLLSFFLSCSRISLSLSLVFVFWK